MTRSRGHRGAGEHGVVAVDDGFAVAQHDLPAVGEDDTVGEVLGGALDDGGGANCGRSKRSTRTTPRPTVASTTTSGAPSGPMVNVPSSRRDAVHVDVAVADVGAHLDGDVVRRPDRTSPIATRASTVSGVGRRAVDVDVDGADHDVLALGAVPDVPAPT